MAGAADPDTQSATQPNASSATEPNTYGEIVEAITSSLVLEEVLSEVAQRIAKAMNIFACDIHDYDAETNQLTMVSYWSEEITPEDREYVGTAVSLADRPAFVNLIKQGGLETSYIDDPDLDPVERREMERWGEKSCLTMPLRMGNEVVGILGILETRFIRRFSDEDIELFKRLAAPAAIAIRNAKTYRQEQQQNRKLASLFEATRAVTSTLVLEDVLALVARSTAEAMGTFAADIFEYSPRDNAMTCAAYWSKHMTREDEEYIGTVISLDERPTYYPYVTAPRLMETQIDDPTIPEGERQTAEQWGETSALVAPLLYGGQLIGLLGCTERGVIRHFTDEDKELFELLAVPAAVAIHNARVYRQQEEQTRRLASLLDAGRAITSIMDLEEVLDVVARMAADAIDVPECLIYEYDKANDAIVVRTSYERSATEPYESRGKSYWLSDWPRDRQVIEGGVPLQDLVSSPDLDETTRQGMQKWGEKSALRVPVIFGDEPVGIVVLVETRWERRFTDDEVEFARGLAEQAAIAIHNAKLYRAQQEQNKRLASLLDASRAITSTVVLDEVLTLVARKAAEALGTPQCIIYEYDKGRDAIIGRALYHSEGEPYDGLGQAHRLADYPGDRAILEGGAIVEERVSDASLDPVTLASMREWGEKTCLNAPLVFGNEPLGILVLIETDQERHFTPEEIELTRGLAEQAATAIHNARAYAREEKRNRSLVTLLATIQSIAGSLDRREVARRVCEQAGGLFPGRVCNVEVRLRDEFGGYVPVRPLEAAEATQTDEGLRSGQGTVADASTETEGELPAAAEPLADPPDALAVAALTELRPRQVSGEGEPARLVCPLVFKDAAVGYIEVVSELAQPFAADEVEIVQILATQAVTAMENARLYGVVERQAITDGLTGLYNHRYFYERLGQEVTRARRYHTPLSLLMLDLDDFKRVNDEFGHQVGDRVLREVARVLLTELRRNVDLAARYGGEEFAILLPNTPAAGAEVVGERLVREVSAIHGAAKEDLASVAKAAQIVGERIRRDIEVTRFTVGDGAPIMRITVSVGVATFSDAVADADALVNAADKALYLAKRLGKNRVEAFH